MSASVQPRLAGRQPSVRGRGAPGEDRARRTSSGQAATNGAAHARCDNAALDGENALFRPAGAAAMPSGSRSCMPTAGGGSTGAPMPTRSWTAMWRPTAGRCGRGGWVRRPTARRWSPSAAIGWWASSTSCSTTIRGGAAWSTTCTWRTTSAGPASAGSCWPRAAGAVVEAATGTAMYLWVLKQNAAAQRFYRACGATSVETQRVSPPGRPDEAQWHSRHAAHGMAGRRAPEPPGRRLTGRAGRVAPGRNPGTGPAPTP